MAEQYPAVQPDSASPGFRLPDHAADAVSRSFGSQSKLGEQAAVIYRRPDGSHVYSTVAPQTVHDRFALRAQAPAGYALSGIIHSHPGDDDDGQKFSPQDIETANKLGVPSYIRFLKDNSIRKYVPGTTHTMSIGSGLRQQRVSNGDQIDVDQQPSAGALSQVQPPTSAVSAVVPTDPGTGALAAVQQQ